MAATREHVQFAMKIVALGVGFPFSVTSWGRTPYHNAHLKPPGLPNSLHLEWLAVDGELDPGADLEEFLGAVHDLGLHYLVESDCIHIQDRPAVLPALSPTITSPGAPPRGAREEGGVPLESAEGAPIQTERI